MGVRSGYIELNKTTLYYEISGSGHPIVFIHGGFCDGRIWDDQFHIFAVDHKDIRYDLRGYGKSALPIQKEHYKHHEDLKALLDHLGIPKAHICGQSLGGAIAVDFVLSYPEMCSSLIVLGPWIFGYHSPSSKELLSRMDKTSLIFREKGKMAAIEHFYNDPIMMKTYKDPNIVLRVKELASDYSFWHFENEDPVSSVDPPAIEQIGKINIPTMIITADNDLEPCKEIADLLALEIPNSQKVIIKDAGHDINVNKPSDFNKIVLDFIRK
jgi:pimeloyl-ACP methyl ester carboxylesterase